VTVPVLRLRGHTGFVSGVCWSPDGKRLISGGQDRLVKVWETATGQELLSLQGHADGVWGVAFSRDGQRLVSASTDGAVKLWEAGPPTPEISHQRNAFGLVESLYAKLGRKADVLAHLRCDTSLSELLRREALSRAERYLAPR
jgi:WD40 repeat protein